MCGGSGSCSGDSRTISIRRGTGKIVSNGYRRATQRLLLPVGVTVFRLERIPDTNY
jgi:hypothetical protein